MDVPAFIARFVGWLRDGYPDGVPERDYIPLLAVLARRLTEAEVRQVHDELIAAGYLPAGHADIGMLITKVTDEMPRQEDIDRVCDHLVAGGWPIDHPAS